MSQMEVVYFILGECSVWKYTSKPEWISEELTYMPAFMIIRNASIYDHQKWKKKNLKDKVQIKFLIKNS